MFSVLYSPKLYISYIYIKTIYSHLISESSLKLLLEAKILTNPLSIYSYYFYFYFYLFLLWGQLKCILSSAFLRQPFWLILNCPFIRTPEERKLLSILNTVLSKLTGLIILYLSSIRNIQTGLPMYLPMLPGMVHTIFLLLYLSPLQTLQCLQFLNCAFHFAG